MKQFFIIAIFAIFAISVLFSQSRTKEKHGVATTSWQTLSSPSGTKLYNPNFSNDATAGADTLWCAVGSDTVWSTIVPLLKGETVQLPTSSNIIRVKTSAGTIPYRMWGFY